MKNQYSWLQLLLALGLMVAMAVFGVVVLVVGFSFYQANREARQRAIIQRNLDQIEKALRQYSLKEEMDSGKPEFDD